MQLISNFNEAENELNEPEFPDVPLLVHVTDIRDRERFVQIKKVLEADGHIQLLKSVEY